MFLCLYWPACSGATTKAFQDSAHGEVAEGCRPLLLCRQCTCGKITMCEGFDCEVVCNVVMMRYNESCDTF